ncbi:N-acetyltransferase family protein [Marinomonas agarivorans]|nr:N-acetyltransferase family protein [Marinomonas agarivorans]
MIRTVTVSDAAALAAIYNYYVDHTVITFEEVRVTVDEFRHRIATALSQGHQWLVLEENNTLIGYAYSGLWKSRSAYRYTHEVTIYLAPDQSGKGFGSQLLTALFQQLANTNIANLMAVIALPNPASVALHESLGMKKVAHFSKVGYKFSQWVDVGYWQLSLMEK